VSGFAKKLMLLFWILSAFRVGERWKKKAKKGLSSVGEAISHNVPGSFVQCRTL
jgi:hypothetical protein